jgi:hypothetical protein
MMFDGLDKLIILICIIIPILVTQIVIIGLKLFELLLITSWFYIFIPTYIVIGLCLFHIVASKIYGRN